MRRLRVSDAFAGFVDHLFAHLLKFTADRAVFDVQVLPSMDSYPIFLHMEVAEELFGTLRPSVGRFTLLEAVAQRSLPAIGFPPDARQALARLAAYATFEAFWGGEKIEAFIDGDLSSLFLTMLALYHRYDAGVFPKAMQYVRTRIVTAEVRSDYYYNMFVDQVYKNADVKDSTHAIGEGEQENVILELAPTLVEYEINAMADLVLD
jgi:hypothetical protein